MKTPYTIYRDNLEPPARETELALFTCALQSPIVRGSLEALGKFLPEQFQIFHNSNPDDPPDVFALDLGWECTEFPPDQSALWKVHEERSGNGEGMVVPGYSQSQGDIRKIRELADYGMAPSPFVNQNDEMAALENIFLTNVFGEKRSKDVFGNDVLLLDQRQGIWPETAEFAIRSALQKKQPKHLKLIFLVRFERNTDYGKPPVPNVVKMYP